MKISRGNTISQIGKTFWRYCYAISTFCTTIYSTTYKGPLFSLICYNWHEGLFFSNNACLPFNAHRSPADLTQHLFYLVPWWVDPRDWTNTESLGITE